MTSRGFGEVLGSLGSFESIQTLQKRLDGRPYEAFKAPKHYKNPGTLDPEETSEHTACKILGFCNAQASEEGRT